MTAEAPRSWYNWYQHIHTESFFLQQLTQQQDIVRNAHPGHVVLMAKRRCDISAFHHLHHTYLQFNTLNLIFLMKVTYVLQSEGKLAFFSF